MAELLIYLAVSIAALAVAWGLVYLWSRSYDRRYRLRRIRERLPMIEWDSLSIRCYKCGGLNADE